LPSTRTDSDAAAAATPLLFTPLKLRGVTARNRIVVSPMCQYSSERGGPVDWHMMHLGRLAVGGPGIVFGEETAVEERGRKTHHCAGIWRDDHVPAYRRLTDFIRAQGAIPAIQLGHCGRKAGCHGATREWEPLTEADARDGFPPWQGVAPSAIPFGPGFMAPKAMDEADIRDVLSAWREATVRSVDAGYDLLGIHGAHGYLIHQFLSPITNRRNDGYGGDRDGRMRLALEVAETVRAAWPADRPLFFRVSAVDGAGGVWGLEDTVALSAALLERGVDVIDVSSGGILGGGTDMPAVPRIPGFQVPFAARIRRSLGCTVMAVGGITEAAQAEAILQGGRADLIALARELIWNPDWPAHAAKALGLADPYGAMPHEYAFRLRKRDQMAAMPFNQDGPESRAAMAHLTGEGM
jgi:2,4-dienoyl-CoA reductase-like NADH-dependent reductase (Old Yellow Enzyme family)